MSHKTHTLAICYDFEVRSHQDTGRIMTSSKLGVKTADFWSEVKRLAREQHGDEILIYMG